MQMNEVRASLQTLYDNSNNAINKAIYNEIIPFFPCTADGAVSLSSIAKAIILLAEGREKIKELKNVPGFFHSRFVSRKSELGNLIDGILKDILMPSNLQAALEKEIQSFNAIQRTTCNNLCVKLMSCKEGLSQANIDLKTLRETRPNDIAREYNFNVSNGDQRDAKIAELISAARSTISRKEAELQEAKKAYNAATQYADTVSEYLTSITSRNLELVR